MHKVMVNHIGGLSLPRKSVDWFTDHPNMTIAVYNGRKTTIQQQLYGYTSKEYYSDLKMLVSLVTGGCSCLYRHCGVLYVLNIVK